MWMSHVTRMSEAQHTYEYRTTSHSRFGDGFRATYKESCQTYEKFMPQISMRHGTRPMNAHHTEDSEMFLELQWKSRVRHMRASCHTYECVMAHVRISHITHHRHVTHVDASWHTYEYVIQRSRFWDGFRAAHRESCQTYECVMSHYECIMAHIRISHITQHNRKWFQSCK